VAVDERYWVESDVLGALQALARHHRRQLGIPVLAITGSNGKTTTKELLSRVLSQRFRVSTTKGNLNNHIGVPLTLLSMTPDTEFAVVEMGANHRGEIASYCAVAEPDYGLITNIGKAHLEGFGGEAGIRKGKGELFDYLSRTGGTAFYLAESDALNEMAAERPELTAYGFLAEALETVSSEGSLLNLRYGSRIIRTNLLGDYNRYNVAAALAVGEYFEVEPSEAVEAIESYVPDNNRSQRIKAGNNILYLDAYNANPSSMAAALENFAKTSEQGYEKALILGDMRELGPYAEEEHRKVIGLLREWGFTEVYLVGEVFLKMNDRNGYRSFADTAGLSAYLEQHPLKQHVILIKGSRGMQLESLVPVLNGF
jgi:UDP-N-acetylmuramoyl-tripeptide--D-alanyl-D-alanine ligase